MPFLTIAGGQSVTDYDGQELSILASAYYTLAVNNSAFHWPCDVVVALDPDWILANVARLKKINRPVITRKWAALQSLDIDRIELPNAIPDRLSGMVATRLTDALARTCKSQGYVIGMDATPGHYYDTLSDCSGLVNGDTYEAMGLTHIINLGIRSKISAWPKRSKLPSRIEVMRPEFKKVYTEWLRGESAKICTLQS